MVRALAAVTIVAFMLFAPSASAAEFGTKDEAVAMVKRVQAKFKKDGADVTFKAVSDQSTKDFHDRDLYPFITAVRLTARRVLERADLGGACGRKWVVSI
jgi:cytochrome c